ncbi:hypothetical protein TRICI_005158 [Trichomonascus ciferrii]|uniref:Uncharacterized protein n=1 Tax=Trichomonascus ciferrii TaxID=44093 RepID=A0A642UW54_9ASCO|nr:hypothetical protein TRICI_005158 [Trichomonascus ciferrii]
MSTPYYLDDPADSILNMYDNSSDTMFSDDDEGTKQQPQPISPVPRRSSYRRSSRPRSLVHKPHFDEHDFIDDYGINDAVDPALINTQPDKPVVGHRRALSAGARRHSSLPSSRLSTSSNAMWDELNSVRQRIERLKTNNNNDDSNNLSSNNNPLHNDPETTPTKHSAATQRQQHDDLVHEQSSTPHSGLFDAQEPMSSPIPSKPHKLTSPSLSRQTPAERHLLEVLDRAKRTRENDIMMVLLERVVTDTMYLYNHTEFKNTEPIDKVCLSLSDYILQLTETNNYAPPPPPPPSIARSSLRYSRSPLYETPPTGLSNTSPSIHPSVARSASIRSEMGFIGSSPISRSNSYSPAPSTKRFLNPRR